MGSGTGSPAAASPIATFARPYASLLDVLDDLELDGVKSHDKLWRFINAASQFIDKRGKFVPVTETRTYTGSGCVTQWIEPLLALASITLDGMLLMSDEYVLLPHNKHWEHGPYTSIELTRGGLWPDAFPSGVVIAGQWGLYSDRVALAATATQTADAETIVVSRAPDVSPGVILDVGGEQEIITGYDDPLELGATLAGAIDDATDVLTLNASDQVERGEIIRCGFEQMRVLDVSAAEAQVGRGWNATARATHADGTPVAVYRAFCVSRAANGTAASAHNATPLYRLLPPYDVRYLCEQIAALMFKKSPGGFAGKTGNAELGEVFYHNEFPKDPLKAVMTNYRIVQI
jgi:hypothetical protein